ncbi:hypothetical protein PGB90_007198 [Kerria lacca]
MNFSIDKELLMKCLKTVVHKNEPEVNINIKHYEQKKCDIEPGGAYLSGLIKVKVDYDCNGKSLTKSFIAKIPSLGINYKLGVDNGVYNKEKYIYEEILPQVKNKMKLKLMPEHYETINSEILILEDLNESGFVIKQNTWFNFEKCKRTLEALAEFHAASYRVHQENPNFFLKNQQETIYIDVMVNQIVQAIFTDFMRILETEENVSDLINKLQNFKNKITPTSILNTCNQKEPWFKVLNHGDLNYNNILFKYNEKNETIDVKFVDFQGCRWNSPVLDIIYFLTICAETELLKNNFEELIDSYLLKLNETLQNLNCQVTYTKTQFNQDLESMNLFRIIVLFWCSYFTLNKVANNFQCDKMGTITSEMLHTIRNNKRYQKYLALYKHYNNIGVFDQ